MPRFTYRGRNSSGQAVSGLMEGDSAAAVADALLAKSITPLSISPAKGGGSPAAPGAGDKPAGGMALALFKEKIDSLDIMMFSRQLNTLLKAGVPIMRALTGLQETTPNRSMKEMLGELRDSLDSGRELSMSLARHPRVFTPFYVSMVRVGEMTGQLQEVFLRLYEHMAFERFMKEQVASALRYPMFVIIAMAAALAVVNLFVIPAFAKVFEGFKTELPLMTKILLGFSHFMVDWWYVILAAIISAGFTFRTWVSTAHGRYLWDKFKLDLPIAGKIVRKATLARFARSFALASRSGVPIIQTLTTVALTVGNDFIAKKVEGMREGVERGESILRTAAAAGIFPPIVMQMIAVGEESGALDELMQEIADMFQKEIEYELKTLAQQIEPILIVMLGIMVMVLALGIFLPMWDLGKVAMKKG